MQKIKQSINQFIQSDRGKDILTVLIVILVGVASFGLGRLSKDDTRAGITVKYSNEATKAISTTEPMASPQSEAIVPPNPTSKTAKTSKVIPGSTNAMGKEFFASKVGHKYYSIGCSGGKTIKQENRIYFSTEAEAVSAGYEKSTSCK